VSESEFYGSPVVVPDLGDPATDPLLTVRMQPPDTQARRLDPRTRRVVKLDPSSAGWHEVGDHAWDMVPDPWHMDYDVRDWVRQDPITLGVAMDRGAGKAVPPPAGKASSAAELVGDMGVESFKGETS
jgi:hypothetical protein